MEIKEIQKEIHEINKSKGFWDKERNTGELLALIHSEISEALEADRDDHHAKITFYEAELKDTSVKTYNPFERYIKNSFEDEIADACIRLFDLAEGRGIDLEYHIRQKVDYNKTRPYKHNRAY